MELPDTTELTPTGYTALIERFSLRVPPHHRRSYIADKGRRRTIVANGVVTEIYEKGYRPEQDTYHVLEFALKYDGVNLCILKKLFDAVDPEALRQGILQTPGGKYARQIWFLYEFLTGVELDLPDPTVTNYIPILDSNEYYTSTGVRSRRHHVLNNLLGVQGFCPIVRKTQKLDNMSSVALSNRLSETLGSYQPDIMHRATAYLYTKETKTSFEIENVEPDPNRMLRFVDLLERAGSEDFLTKDRLVELQRQTVDERFVDGDYRDEQAYVGQSVRLGNEVVHYVAPKPTDVEDLMAGWLETARRLVESKIDSVVAAAVTSFGFVFVHPFTDGNGRIHRFLLHHLLSRRGFTPAGYVFPISATMLRQRRKYDEILETISDPLMGLVTYDLDTEGRMSVMGHTADFYRYLDLTEVTEGLFELMEETLAVDLVEELDFLVRYDRAKTEVQRVVDLPDRLLDLFIRLVVQNQGRLSDRKRNRHFRMLDDDEIVAMEEAVRESFDSAPEPEGRRGRLERFVGRPQNGN